MGHVILIESNKPTLGEAMARRKGRSLTRQDVIQAAIRCIDAEGEQALGVNRVARELGIKPPSLYNHVDGNEDLRKAVAVEGWRLVLELLEVLQESEEVGGLLKSIMQTYHQFATERPALSAVLATTPIDPFDEEFFDIEVALIVENMRALQRFNLSDRERVAAAHYIRATNQGYIALEHTKIVDRQLCAGVYEWMLNRIVDSLKADSLPDRHFLDNVPFFTVPDGGFDDIHVVRAHVARQLRAYQAQGTLYAQ